MDLGELNWSVRADTSDLERAKREMEQTRESAEGGRRATEDLGRGAEQAGRRTQTATQRMDSGFKNVQRAIQLASGALAAFGAQRVLSSIVNEVQLLERNMLRTQQLIETTGRAATRSAEGLRDQARGIALATLQSTEGVMQAQQTLMTFRNITGDVFDDAIAGAVDLSAAMGQDLNASVLQLGKALEDPIRGMTALSRSGTVFTDAQREMVREMVETNRTAEAQQFILNELAAQYGGVAAREAEGLAGAQDTLGQRIQEAKLEFADQFNLLERGISTYGAASNAVLALTENMDKVIRAGEVLTVLVGARLTAALATATAAKIASTAALGGMSIAAATTTAAVTALRTALMLLGGPLGLLIGAGGLLYVFRDELNLTGHRAGLTEDQIADLRAEMADMSQEDLSGSLDSLNQALDQATLKAAIAREELAALRADVGRGEGGLGVFREIDARHELAAASNAVADAENRIAEINDRINVARGETAKRIEQNASALVVYGERLKNEREETELAAVANTAMAASLDESAQAANGLSNELNSLRRRLDPAYARQQDLARATATLDMGLRTGAITLEQYLQLWDSAAETFIDAGRESEILADTTVDVTNEMTREWERFGNAIDDVFVDAFKGAFDSFESFADRLSNAFETLMAELAWSAAKNEIKIQLGMGGSGGGILGGGGLNLSSLGNIGSLFGGGSAAASGGLYANAATGAAQGGLYGNVATGGVAQGGGMMSGLAAQAGPIAAMYAFASMGNQLLQSSGAYDALGIRTGGRSSDALGQIAPIGGTLIGSALDSLGIGGRRTRTRLDLATTTDADARFEDSISAQGAFGQVGFSEAGSERLSRAFGEDFGAIEQFVSSIAQLDNAIAGFSESASELDAMAEAVRSVEIRGGSAQDIQEQLEDRGRAAIDAMTGEFGRFVQSLEGGVEEVVAQAQYAQGAHNILASAMGRLNLTFETGTEASFGYAAAIADQVGGVQNLAALQSSYYQAFFSDAERAANLQNELTQSLNAMGMQLPATRQGFRDLVEAQDSNTEAGQQNYATLLQLSGGFDELSRYMGDANATIDIQLEQYRTLNEELMIASGAWDESTSAILAANSAMATLNMSSRTYIEAINQLSQKDATQLRDFADDLGLSFLEIQAVIADIIAGNDALTSGGGASGGSSGMSYEDALKMVDQAKNAVKDFSDVLSSEFGGSIPSVNQALAQLGLEDVPPVDTSALDNASNAVSSAVSSIASEFGNAGGDIAKLAKFIADEASKFDPADAGSIASMIGDRLNNLAGSVPSADEILSAVEAQYASIGLTGDFEDRETRIGFWVSQIEKGTIDLANLSRAFTDSLADDSWHPSDDDYTSAIDTSGFESAVSKLIDQLFGLESAFENVEGQQGDAFGEYADFIRALQELARANNALQNVNPPSESDAPASDGSTGQRATQEARMFDRLNRQHLELLGDVSALREMELEGMSDRNRELQESIWAIQDEAEAQSALNSERERLAQVYQSRVALEQQLAELTGDTVAQQRWLAESRRIELEAMDESLRPLQERVWLLQDEAEAIQGVERAIVSAFSELERAVQQERDIAQDAFDAVRDSITSNMDDIRDSLRDTERAASSLRSALDQMIDVGIDQRIRREQGQAELRRILASGGLGDRRELDRALAAVSEPSEELFGSFVDYQRDFWQTANVVEELYERADDQLTVEERSLRALEDQLKQAESEHEAEMERLDALLDEQRDWIEQQYGQLDGIHNAILTIPDAIASLASALESAASAPAEQDEPLFGTRPIMGNSDPLWSTRPIMGSSDPLFSNRTASSALPRFANGGDHSGGWRMVGERGPEIEYTGPSRITSNNDIMRMNDELTAEVKQLREDLRGVMRPIAESTARTSETLESWDYGGQPAQREEVDA